MWVLWHLNALIPKSLFSFPSICQMLLQCSATTICSQETFSSCYFPSGQWRQIIVLRIFPTVRLGNVSLSRLSNDRLFSIVKNPEMFVCVHTLLSTHAGWRLVGIVESKLLLSLPPCLKHWSLYTQIIIYIDHFLSLMDSVPFFMIKTDVYMVGYTIIYLNIDTQERSTVILCSCLFQLQKEIEAMTLLLHLKMLWFFRRKNFPNSIFAAMLQ